MKWNDNEIEFLKENYPKNISLSNIADKLHRSVRSIEHKAVRMDFSRPRFPSNNPSRQQPKQVIDKRYYDKHKKIVYERKKNRRKKLKEEAVSMLGGKCKICGYNKCFAALDFHHERDNKKGGINLFLKNQSRQKLLKEARKCILLCANCHRELHHIGSVG